jgi:hypothetical protein
MNPVVFRDVRVADPELGVIVPSQIHIAPTWRIFPALEPVRRDWTGCCYSSPHLGMTRTVWNGAARGSTYSLSTSSHSAVPCWPVPDGTFLQSIRCHAQPAVPLPPTQPWFESLFLVQLSEKRFADLGHNAHLPAHEFSHVVTHRGAENHRDLCNIQVVVTLKPTCQFGGGALHGLCK